jgi:hypothetical protein
VEDRVFARVGDLPDLVDIEFVNPLADFVSVYALDEVRLEDGAIGTEPPASGGWGFGCLKRFSSLD